MGDVEICERVQQKLDTMNENWDALQKKALSNTPAAVKQQTDGFTLEHVFIEPDISPYHSFDSDSDEEVQSFKQQMHFKYQMIFSELFDWLSSCDDSLSRAIPSFINVEIIRCRLFSLQVGINGVFLLGSAIHFDLGI